MKVSEKGFSLVEVLVALALFSVGVMGVTKLHLQSLALVQSASHHSAMVRIAQGLAEAMSANREGSLKGYYQAKEVIDLASVSNCKHSECTSRELARFDLAGVDFQLTEALPGASRAVLRLPSSSPSSVPRFLLRLYWGGAREGESEGLCSSVGAGSSCWQIELGIEQEEP